MATDGMNTRKRLKLPVLRRLSTFHYKLTVGVVGLTDLLSRRRESGAEGAWLASAWAAHVCGF